MTDEEERITCPSCRGRGRVIARFRFVAPPPAPYVPPEGGAAQPTMHIIHSTDGSAASSFRSAQDPLETDTASAFPWWPAAGAQPAPYYHASTRLPNGRLAIIPDCGAWTSLVGLDIAREIAAAAVAAGHTPTQRRLSQPLAVQGVGNGLQHAEWEISLPIAVPSADGAADLYQYEAPVVGGEGAGLPPLLGLRSMSEKDAVMETGRTHRRLTFPGPGGYQINWSPGTMHFPLESAPSGHYCIPCDAFSQIRRPTGGLAPTTMTLHATTAENMPQTAGPLTTPQVETSSAASANSTPAPVTSPHRRSANPLVRFQ